MWLPQYYAGSVSLKSPGELRDAAQLVLIDFLTTDIGLAFTFLETARIEKQYDSARFQAVLYKVERALSRIRQFQDRVGDLGQRAEIRKRADRLEYAHHRLAEVAGYREPSIE
jgi:hypothetical protein